LPKRTDIRTVALIGSGPIVIGQACEFDYSGSQALRVLRAEGMRTVLINSNPATIMTDGWWADRTYLEPLDLEGATAVLRKERPDALLPTLGGQTALNLASDLYAAGVLEELGIELIGASYDAIRRAEDRELFAATVAEIGLRVPTSVIATSMSEAAAALAQPLQGKRRLTATIVEEAVQRRNLLYDRGGEEHYNIISALHKSLRDSDPDASLYWLARMLEAGEDPLYVVRRLIRFASEDIGMADPQALSQAVAAQQAAHFIGMPEANLALAQAVVYLATAPKSNALYAAYSAVQEDVARTRADPVPLHLRNAPTPLMKKIGYGKGYRYAHDYEEAQVEQQHLPDAIKDRTYYHPSERGYEKTVKERLDAFEAARRKTSKS
jgi:hypothetical protein